LPHARTLPAIAALVTGWTYFLCWASQVLTADEVQATLTAIEGQLRCLEATSGRYLAEADPVGTWVGDVVAALRSGRCHVTRRGDIVTALDDTWGWAAGIPQGEHIGWVDRRVLRLKAPTAPVLRRLQGWRELA